MTSFHRILFFTAGCALLVFVVAKIGVNDIATTLSKIQQALIPLFFISLAWHAIQNRAWQRILFLMGHRAGFWRLFFVRLAGVAVATLTPLNIIAGDALRFHYLNREIPPPLNAAALVLDRGFQFLATAILVAATSLILVLAPGLTHSLRLLLAGVIVGTAVCTWLLFKLFQNGLSRPIVPFLTRLPLVGRAIPALARFSIQFDGALRGVVFRSNAVRLELLTYHAFGKFLGVIEIYVLCRALALPASLADVTVYAILSLAISAAFAFIPSGVGVMEAGLGYAAFELASDAASGVVLQLTRRLRQIFWVIPGLLAVLFLKSNSRRKHEADSV